MYITIDDLIKIGLSIVVGGLIGFEREYRDKAAGFRTIIFITLGSTLFTILSIKFAGPANDPMRVAANILTGIGFIGAGAILRGEHGVIGLTTAATIWLVSALGLGIGGGEYALVGVATAVIQVVLWVFPFVEKLIANIRHTHIYTITIPCEESVYNYLQDVLEESGLKLVSAKRTKAGGRYICQWVTSGSPKIHTHLVEVLLEDPQVLELNY